MLRKTLALAAALAALASAAPRAAAAQELKHALALEMLEAMGVPRQLQASVDAMVRQEAGTSPEAVALRDVMRDFFARYLTWDALKDRYADVYAAAFSEDELREITAFYRSSTGQKLSRSAPALLARGAAIGEETVRAHQDELQEMIVRRLPGLQTPQPQPSQTPPPTQPRP